MHEILRLPCLKRVQEGGLCFLSLHFRLSFHFGSLLLSGFSYLANKEESVRKKH